MSLRWDPCVTHGGEEAWGFLEEYFQKSSNVWLIAGAGFDPRATMIPLALSKVCGDRLSGLYFREERRSVEEANRERAEKNAQVLSALDGTSTFVSIEIFSEEDGAVVGGRRAVDVVGRLDLSSCRDLVIDLSALSKGVAFPVVKLLLQLIDTGQLKANLHLLVIDDSRVDSKISATSSDKVEEVHGFGGGRTLSSQSNRVQLWIPQLVSGMGPIADRIFHHLDPDEVCPVLPFPSIDPYDPARLLFEYREQVESRWDVSEGGLIHAAEWDPLDLYRSILRLDTQRAEIFGESRGALTILSPLGSKMLSIGALMAALERNLPIVHVEAVGYDVDWAEAAEARDGTLIHVWLAGEASLTAISEGAHDDATATS